MTAPRTLLRGRGLRWSGVAALLLLLASPLSAAPDQDAAGTRSAPEQTVAPADPARIDPGPFAALAKGEDRVVEVSVTGPLLRAAGTILRREEPELAEMLRGLRAVQAVVIEPGEGSSPAAGEAGLRAIAQTAESLGARGWDRLAKVQSPGESLQLWILSAGDDRLDGLVAMIREPGGKLVFVNIAGAVDLARLAELGEQFGISGLDKLPETAEPPEADREDER